MRAAESSRSALKGQGLPPQHHVLVIVLSVSLGAGDSALQQEEGMPLVGLAHQQVDLIVDDGRGNVGTRHASVWFDAGLQGLGLLLDTHVDGQCGQGLFMGHVFVKRAHAHTCHGGHLTDRDALVATLQQNPNKGLLQGLRTEPGPRLLRLAARLGRKPNTLAVAFS
jgi:hypothetical protein